LILLKKYEDYGLAAQADFIGKVREQSFFGFFGGFLKMLGLLISTAYAQAANTAATATTAAAATPAHPSMLETLFPFAIMLACFYLFLGRPQQKKMKAQQEFLKALKKGDQVVTTGGIQGEITGLTDTFVTLQIADNVRIKVVRNQVSGAFKEGAAL
jgi:preprotein translocase subunit YajC